MGGAAKTIGRVGSGILTLGGSEIARNNLPRNNVIRNALGLPGTILSGGMAGQDQMPALFGGGDAPNPYIGGPFSLDPAQLASDKAAITGLGNTQFGETNAFNTQDQAARATGRTKLADLLTQQAQQSFARTLPTTAEDYNAGHLLNSSGYGNEVARQQGQLAGDIANKVGQAGLLDMDRSSGIGLGALQAKQGMGQSALSRQFSLEDFVNQANVAKTIGAQTAPTVPGGKASGLAGGLGGAAAGAPFGPWGAGIGGLGGLLLGSQANKQGK